MRKNLLLAGVLATLATCAQAQDAPGAEHNPTGLRPFIGLGFTSGGDSLQKITVTTQGSSTQYRENISAGGGWDLRAGLSQKLGSLPLSAQVAVAYHIDQDAGLGGTKYKFRRVPLEASLLWHATDRTRIGFGVRKSTHAVNKITKGQFRLSNGSTVVVNGQDTLKGNLGWILEAEYAVTPNWSLKGRYVFEQFSYRDAPEAEKVDADHLGVHSIWYFN